MHEMKINKEFDNIGGVVITYGKVVVKGKRDAEFGGWMDGNVTDFRKP